MKQVPSEEKRTTYTYTMTYTGQLLSILTHAMEGLLYNVVLVKVHKMNYDNEKKSRLVILCL